jgi:hypothetical protein
MKQRRLSRAVGADDGMALPAEMKAKLLMIDVLPKSFEILRSSAASVRPFLAVAYRHR